MFFFPIQCLLMQSSHLIFFLTDNSNKRKHAKHLQITKVVKKTDWECDIYTV